MTSHLDDGTIHELLDGEIPSAQLPPLQAHLAACAECRARLDAARELVDFGDELVELLDDPPVVTPAPVIVAPRPTPGRPWIRQLAWAASIAVAVGAGWYARGDVQRVLPPVSVDSPIAEAISAVPPAVVTAPPATSDRQVAPPSVARERFQPATKPAEDLAGARNEAAAKSALAERPSVVEPAPVAPPAAAPAAAPAGGAAVRGMRTEQTARGGGLPLGSVEARRDARDQVMTKQLIDIARVDTISFTTASEAMGGKLRLIDGLVPARFERVGTTVRVVYRLGNAEVQLVQLLVGTDPQFTLQGPPGFPVDSLAALRRRVRE